MIVAVILAAGLSRRMGQPKLLLLLEGRPVIRHAVERVIAGGVAEAIVVTAPERDALETALAGLAVRFAVNPDPAAGQASSIAAGIAAVPATTTAALIALGDQPALDRRIIPALLETRRRTDRPVVAPRYRHELGTPVLFGAEVFPELLALTGDRGARAVVEREPDRVAFVDFDLPMPQDVDTPAEYERLRTPGKPV